MTSLNKKIVSLSCEAQYFASKWMPSYAVTLRPETQRNKLTYIVCDSVADIVCEFQEGISSGYVDGVTPEILAHSNGCQDIVLLANGTPVLLPALPNSRRAFIGDINNEKIVSSNSYVFLPYTGYSSKEIQHDRPDITFDSACEAGTLLNFCLNNKILSRLVTQMVAPKINPSFWVSERNNAPNLDSVYLALGRPVLLKEPCSSRGKGIYIINFDSQTEFEGLLNKNSFNFLLLESFKLNTTRLNDQPHQFSLRTYYLYEPSADSLCPIQARVDYSLEPVSEKPKSFKSMICQPVAEAAIRKEKITLSSAPMLNKSYVVDVLRAFHHMTTYDVLAFIFKLNQPVLNRFANMLLPTQFFLSVELNVGKNSYFVSESALRFSMEYSQYFSYSSKIRIARLLLESKMHFGSFKDPVTILSIKRIDSMLKLMNVIEGQECSQQGGRAQADSTSTG